jgi:cyclohexadienyl dehydratase
MAGLTGLLSLPAGGEFIGMDVELARALGMRLQLVQTSWPTLMADLGADMFDLALGGINAFPRFR